jgi:hypothetical protein
MNILEESKKTDQNRSTSNKITWANNCNYSIDCLVCKHQATSWFPARLVTVSTSLQDICRNGFKAGHVGAPWWYAELVLSFVLGKTHQNPWTSHDCDIFWPSSCHIKMHSFWDCTPFQPTGSPEDWNHTILSVRLLWAQCFCRECLVGLCLFVYKYIHMYIYSHNN